VTQTQRRGRRNEIGALLFGLIVLAVGCYYLLRNTLGFDLPELNWDMLWPVLIIGLGISVVYGALNRSRPDDPNA
jgi:hypothetical protein